MKKSLFALALAVCLLGAAEMWGQTADPTTTVYVSGPATKEIRTTTWGPACSFPTDVGPVVSGGSRFRPMGIGFGGDGRIYFVSKSRSEVGRVNTDGSVDIISSASSSKLKNPSDIIFAGGDAITTSRAGNKKSGAGLYVFPDITGVPDGGPFEPPAPLVQFNSGGKSSAAALGLLFERTLLATEISNEEVLGFSFPYDELDSDSPVYAIPFGLAADGVGDDALVYVGFPRTGQIKRFAVDFVGGVYAGLTEDPSWIVTLPPRYRPRHLDTDLEGNLYVAASKKSNGRDGQLYCIPFDFPGGTPTANIPLDSAWGVAVAAGSEVTRATDFGSPLKLCGDQITLTSGTESFTVDLTCRDITEAEFRDLASDSDFPFAKCLQEPGKSACTFISVSGVPDNFDDTVLVDRIFVPFADFDEGPDGQYGTADDLVKDPGILYSRIGGSNAFDENILTALSDALIDDIDPTRMTGRRDDFGSELMFCEDCNGPPRIDPLQDVEAEADPETEQVNVVIDVNVLDLGPLIFEWALLDGPGGSLIEILAVTEDLDAAFGPGEHFVRFTATDSGYRPLSSEDEVMIFVSATEVDLPIVTGISANPNNLWPPNGHLAPIVLTVSADGGSGGFACKVLSITHDEVVSGQGDGYVDPDWEFSFAQEFQEWPLEVKMRAELADGDEADGRTYSATVVCRDSAGSVSDPFTEDVVTVMEYEEIGD